MGLFGKLVGWDQQKDAHNAVLANYVAETASLQLKNEIVNRLIIIQQQVTGSRDDPHSILADLCSRPRIVQMNFIALACNSLGISPGLGGLSFTDVQNPYNSQNESSLNRIGVSLDDLSRRSGRSLNWPGNDLTIDFLAWAQSPAQGLATKSDSHRSAARTTIQNATELADSALLLEVIDREQIEVVVTDLFDMVGAKSDHELAAASALFFFEREELMPHLRSAQMMARMIVLSWLEEGKITPAVGRHFENTLYELYN